MRIRNSVFALALSVALGLYFNFQALAAETCAKPNAYTDQNDFLAAQASAAAPVSPLLRQAAAPAAPDFVNAPSASKSVIPSSSRIENDFFKGALMQMALGAADNLGCSLRENKAAFLVGARQGLSGNRFSAFYQPSEDSAKELEAFKSFACTEYGIPKNSKNAMKIDYEFLLRDSKSAQLVKSVFEFLEKDNDKNITAREFGRLHGSSPYRENIDQLKSQLAAELERLSGQKVAPAEIDVDQLLKAPFNELSSQAKRYKCCMSGFQASFVYFLSRVKYSQAEPCTQAAQCKDDFAIGRQAAEKACTTGKCEGCRLGDLLNNNKDLRLGCASAGFMDAIWYSEACLAAQQKKNKAAQLSQMEAAAKITSVQNKGVVSGGSQVQGSGASAGAARQQGN